MANEGIRVEKPDTKPDASAHRSRVCQGYEPGGVDKDPSLQVEGEIGANRPSATSTARRLRTVPGSIRRAFCLSTPPGQ